LISSILDKPFISSTHVSHDMSYISIVLETILFHRLMHD